MGADKSAGCLEMAWEAGVAGEVFRDNQLVYALR